MIVSWCNGSTTGFGSVCSSSNLDETTTKQSINFIQNIIIQYIFDNNATLPEALSVIIMIR